MTEQDYENLRHQEFEKAFGQLETPARMGAAMDFLKFLSFLNNPVMREMHHSSQLNNAAIAAQLTVATSMNLVHGALLKAINKDD